MPQVLNSPRLSGQSFVSLLGSMWTEIETIDSLPTDIPGHVIRMQRECAAVMNPKLRCLWGITEFSLHSTSSNEPSGVTNSTQHSIGENIFEINIFNSLQIVKWIFLNFLSSLLFYGNFFASVSFINSK